MNIRFDNITPLAPGDYAIGRALVQLGEMLDAGVAVDRPPLRLPLATLTHIPMHRNAYPDSTEKQAMDSLWRAGRQYVKGNLTDEEFREINRRCDLVLAHKRNPD